jgi:hypothetical protein
MLGSLQTLFYAKPYIKTCFKSRELLLVFPKLKF